MFPQFGETKKITENNETKETPEGTLSNPPLTWAWSQYQAFVLPP